MHLHTKDWRIDAHGGHEELARHDAIVDQQLARIPHPHRVPCDQEGVVGGSQGHNLIKGRLNCARVAIERWITQHRLHDGKYVGVVTQSSFL